MWKQGLHKGLGTEDITSDRAGGKRQVFSWSGGANGSHSSCSSSFVLRGVSYQTDGFISTEGLYHTSHLWAQTRGQRTTSNYQRLAISQGATPDEGKMVDELVCRTNRANAKALTGSYPHSTCISSSSLNLKIFFFNFLTPRYVMDIIMLSQKINVSL